MTERELICVICPNGCDLKAVIEEEPRMAVKEITGELCEKGPVWAEQELLNPVRTIASSIVVDGGDYPLVSVRTDTAIPLKSISSVMKTIKSVRAKAPVRIGDILIREPAGTSCNIIATRHVNEAPGGSSVF
jgi:CxxC motif-containing protein